jgi:N-acetylglucosaminyl-diphospho-decaprenol L-rhamnosyltransferase
VSVEAILVHYGDPGPTHATAARLMPAVDRVLVVDNSVNFGEAPAVPGRVEVLVPGDNIGFGPAVNVAARAARAEFLLLHNPDAVLAPACVEMLLTTARTHPRLAVVAPRLTHGDGSSQVNGGRFSGWLRELARCTGAGRPLRRVRALARREAFAPPASGPVERPWVSGAVMLVRREALLAVGGFDERFFLYYEDEDLCRRLRRLGWRVAVDATVTATHAVGGSGSGEDPYRSVHFETARRTYHRLHSGPVLRRLVGWDASRRTARLDGAAA